ncbi:MAG: hypothetical protein ACLRPW_04650 [Intestinibacter sp.]
MGEIVTANAKMLRGEAELIELSSVPPLANNKDLATEVTGYVKDIVGEQGKYFYLKVGEWVLKISLLILMKFLVYT